MTKKDGSGILNLIQHRFRIVHRNVEMLRSQQICQFGCFGGTACKNQSSVVFQRLTRQIATGQLSQLQLQCLLHGCDQRRMPCDEHTGAWTVLSLRDQICGHKFRSSGFVGKDNDFAGASDTVDVHVPEDVLLGKGDKQVARSDNFVNSCDAIHTICQRRYSLCPADTIDFRHTNFMAGRQHIDVITAKGCWWDHDRDFPNSGRHRRDSRHQHSRWIRSSTPWHADADAFHRQVPLSQLDRSGPDRSHDPRIVRQDGPLKLCNIVANFPNRIKEFGRRLSRG